MGLFPRPWPHTGKCNWYLLCGGIALEALCVLFQPYHIVIIVQNPVRWGKKVKGRDRNRERETQKERMKKMWSDVGGKKKQTE